jgi:hypothetical protein
MNCIKCKTEKTKELIFDNFVIYFCQKCDCINVITIDNKNILLDDIILELIKKLLDKI